MRLFLAAFLTASVSAGSLTANRAAAQDTGGATDQQRAIQTLVEQLASTDFATRQAATRELMQLTADSLPDLTAALKAATGETEFRLRQVVEQLRRHLFDEQLAAWRAADDSSLLPDAERYFQMIQPDDRTRRVLGEVIGAERHLFTLRQFAANELPDALEARSAEFSRQCHGRAEEPFPVASALALMLLASNAEVRLPRATSSNISDALDDPRFEELLEQGAFADVITAVTSAWLKRPGIAVERPLIFCMRHELPAGRDIALRIIEAQSRRQDMAWSLLCLASLNDAASLPQIEQLLDSPIPLWPPRGQAVQDLLPDREVKSTYAVQTRDIALAVGIHLRGEQPADFGFEPEASELSVFTLESLGFATDDERDVAIARYRSRFPAP